MISLGRSHGSVRAALTLLAILPAAPVGAQVAPYKIAEAELPIVSLWAKVKRAHPVLLPRQAVHDLEIVVREDGRTLTLDEARRWFGKRFQVRGELTGPGFSGPLPLPRAGDPSPADPLVLRLPPFPATGEYTLSGLRLVSGERKVLDVAPGRLVVKVIEPESQPIQDDEDTTPPSTIMDLSATASGPGRVQLSWTAPHEEGPMGAAASYSLFYYTRKGFKVAKVVSGPTPAPGGTPETFEVDGLRPHATYYFKLHAADDVYNSSESNVASVTVR